MIYAAGAQVFRLSVDINLDPLERCYLPRIHRVRNNEEVETSRYNNVSLVSIRCLYHLTFRGHKCFFPGAQGESKPW